MSIDFSKWHTKDETPEIRRQFIANCDNDHTFYICGILDSNGYMGTSIGTTYWFDMINKYGLRYWYYIDEIGKETYHVDYNDNQYDY